MKRVAVAVAAALISHTINPVFCEGSSEYYAYLAVYRLSELSSIIAKLEKSSFDDDQKKLEKIESVMKSREFKKYCKHHVQLTVCNPGKEILKITYSKKGHYTDLAKRSFRSRKVRPRTTAQIIVPKDEAIYYRKLNACPQECDQTDEHYHWGEKCIMYYKHSQLICLSGDEMCG